MKSPIVALFLLTSAEFALAGTYSQRENLVGSNFLDAFHFENIVDPTHGRVNYVDQATAEQKGLVSSTRKKFILRADNETRLSPNGPGRDSFRIQSNDKYGTHVAVFDINHMPEGCGTWPAVWEVGDNWPHGGEIDILEGVNDQGNDKITAHTDSGCTMPAQREQTGTTNGTNCDVAVTSNQSCGVDVRDPNSYGPSFNEVGGGWYAIERTDTFIKVWFWTRRSASVPLDVRWGVGLVNTDLWGTPTAYFPNTSCDIDSHFAAQNIIINLTFCGDWAGNSAVYGSSGCPSTCTDYVDNNPSAFTSAYFDFASLRIYE